MKYEQTKHKLEYIWKKENDSQQNLTELEEKNLRNKKRVIEFNEGFLLKKKTTYISDFEDINYYRIENPDYFTPSEGHTSDELWLSVYFCYYKIYKIELYKFPLYMLPYVKTTILWQDNDDVKLYSNSNFRTPSFFQINDSKETDTSSTPKHVTLWSRFNISPPAEERVNYHQVKTKIIVTITNPFYYQQTLISHQ